MPEIKCDMLPGEDGLLRTCRRCARIWPATEAIPTCREFPDPNAAFMKLENVSRQMLYSDALIRHTHEAEKAHQLSKRQRLADIKQVQTKIVQVLKPVVRKVRGDNRWECLYGAGGVIVSTWREAVDFALMKTASA